MQSQFNAIPDITKNLIILNLLMFLASLTLGNAITPHLMAYYVQNPMFQPFQLVTSFFMHGGVMHIFFNMLVLFMFGADVERTLGPKKFLFLYLSAGFVANLLYLLANYGYVQYLTQGFSPDQMDFVANKTNQYFTATFVPEMVTARDIWLTPSLGASGATYGVLFTFAMLYPSRILHLLLPPISIKAKYLAIGLVCMELYQQVFGVNTNIGHFVHLSGAAIAVGLILLWRKQGARF
ncbi:MAG: rhomboid family intramembrane serine protease [Aureispira sp.]|nr:rhomboid family intramembrane serine protease [Aureispira sp.]